MLTHILGGNRGFDPDRLEHIKHVIGRDQIDALLLQRFGALPLGFVRLVLKTLFLFEAQLLGEIKEQDRVLGMAFFITGVAGVDALGEQPVGVNGPVAGVLE